MFNQVFNAANWYWVIPGGDPTRIYSSAAAGYVSTNDATYDAWLLAGHSPTRIVSEAELHDVLAAQYPAGLGTLGTVQQRAGTMLQGSTVTLTSTATSALNGTYTVSAQSMANIAYIQTGIAAGVMPAAFPYSDAAGADHTFTDAQFTAFGAAVLGYVFALDRCAQGKSDTLPSSALSIA